MSYLTRDDILGASDRKVEDVDVPEWGGVVRVRGMTGEERDAFEASIAPPQPRQNRRRATQQQAQLNYANFRARLCSWCIVGDNDERLFSDTGISALGGKSAAALDRVFDATTRRGQHRLGVIAKRLHAKNKKNPMGEWGN